jgi:hypothetical protein
VSYLIQIPKAIRLKLNKCRALPSPRPPSELKGANDMERGQYPMPATSTTGPVSRIAFNRFSTGSLAKFTAMRHASSRYLRYSGAAGAHKRALVKSNLPHGAL